MIYSKHIRRILSLNILLIIFIGCTSQDVSVGLQEKIVINNTATPKVILPTNTPAPQTFSMSSIYGPDIENFPINFNPLTGQEVEDPTQLQTPALLISISHFPPAARPQYGLSFTPWIFEFYITEGATRFLSVFYGTFPEADNPQSGDCEIRKTIFQQTSNILGNRVWLDENKNGIQEDYEKGAGGICVNLYNSSNQLIQQTTTDSNGYYGFNVETGKYFIEFEIPEWLAFTQSNLGDEDKDSDANQASGVIEADVVSSLLHLDAGLILTAETNPNLDNLPTAQVGPIRSGRLLYYDIHQFFGSSCLIYAFADPDVLEQIPQCVFVPHDIASGGAMMSLERMQKISADNKRLSSSDFNYSGNLFADELPIGGVPADQINVYVAYLNQSGWTYDPLSESWWRSVDDANVQTAGQLHYEIDQLTGRQLQFENVIIIFAEHEVIEPTMIDMDLSLGNGGFGYLFRDGMKYDIRWSTKARDYEKKSGQARPLYFVDANGNQVPLKPGRTWIFIATPYSSVYQEQDGIWEVRYSPPEGAK